jgi:zinc protease
VDAGQVQAFAKAELDPAKASVIVAGDGKTLIPPLKAAAPRLEVVPITDFDPDNPSLKAGS